MKSHTKEHILTNNADSKMSQWVKLEDVEKLIKAADEMATRLERSTDILKTEHDAGYFHNRVANTEALTTYTKLKQELDL